MWIKGWQHRACQSIVRIAEPWRNGNCSTANLRTRQTGWCSVTKPLFAQWTKNVKCNIQICFHLWQSVNENKCVTAVWIQPKLLTKIYWIHDVWEFRRQIKLLKRWCCRPLREFSVSYGNWIRRLRDLIVVESRMKILAERVLVSDRLKYLHSA